MRAALTPILDGSSSMVATSSALWIFPSVPLTTSDKPIWSLNISRPASSGSASVTLVTR